jgi:hypothetical protein
VQTDRGFKVKGIGWNWVQDEEADPLYLPPEAMDRMSKQDLGHTKEADIFALGYLLGELYTNRSVRDVFLSEPQFKDASGKPDKYPPPFHTFPHSTFHISHGSVEA